MVRPRKYRRIRETGRDGTKYTCIDACPHHHLHCMCPVGMVFPTRTVQNMGFQLLPKSHVFSGMHLWGREEPPPPPHARAGCLSDEEPLTPPSPTSPEISIYIPVVSFRMGIIFLFFSGRWYAKTWPRYRERWIPDHVPTHSSAVQSANTVLFEKNIPRLEFPHLDLLSVILVIYSCYLFQDMTNTFLLSVQQGPSPPNPPVEGHRNLEGRLPGLN